MHILFITDNFYPEGNAIASRVYERACYWVKWGHTVTVITSAPNFPEGKLYAGYQNKWFQRENLNGISVIRVKTFIQSNKGFFLRIVDFLSFMLPAFFVALFQKKPGAIVATSPQFFGAIAACLASKCKRVPFFLELGDIWPASIVGVGAMKESIIIRILEKIELWLYRISNKIIVVSPHFKDDLTKRGVSAEKIAIILNGVDLSKYAPKPKSQLVLKKYAVLENKFIIGYIGTHGMAHALENVLKTAEILRNNSQIQFMFVGTGAEKEYLVLKAREMKLSNVIFIPAQSKADISDYWSLCDIALVHFKNSPAFSSAVPSKIFEAMGMGLPIILSSPKGAASDIIIGEKVGLCVLPENPDDLAAAVLKLYNDQELLLEYAKTSQLSAKNHTREAQAHYFLEAILIELGQQHLACSDQAQPE